ncbi:MAG: molybdopterin oxidoreductase family protein [Actinomyces sp.]|nr:MAG: molybdopterin oxidoreductase family protein [Actinomyces sp.]
MTDAPASPDERIAYRTCPLCEATCGLEITVRDGRVHRIRGDRDDVFSHGFICPKGSTLQHLHEDPDRLRRPLVRRGVDADGAPVFEEVDWDEAWRIVAERFAAVRDAHGADAVALYLGNPNAHLLASGTHMRALIRSMGSRKLFSASTVDQMPRHVASGHLYGDPVAIPVPDLDRTDMLVVIGADPYTSNGSVCTAPGFPDRIEAMQARGGTLWVIDPRRSRTAQQADVHLRPRPGTDAVLLAAVVRHLFATGTARTGRLAAAAPDLDRVAAFVEPFTPEAAARVTGVAAADITALADALVAAPTAAVYGRIGTNTVEFGTLTAWLIDVVNMCTGNVDRPGGVMFARPAAERCRGDRPGGRGYRVGRWTSRVNGRPEVQGELPVADLADEILVPGEGRIRLLVTVAGNPVLSCPDGERLDEALASLDAMIAVDIYLNETTRHADVILPPPSSLEKSHYDLALYQFHVRNVAHWSPPVFPPSGPLEEDILAKLAAIAAGLGPDADPALVHDQILRSLVEAEVANEHSPIAGRDPDEILAAVDGDTPADRVLDVLVRTGPYGDGFGARPDGLSLAVLAAHPHGVDLGPLEPRLPGRLRTPSGVIEVLADPFVTELARLAQRLDHEPPPLVLIGRRQLRSNNSWMHNLEVLVRGSNRCTLQVNPADAERLGLVDGGDAEVRSRVGAVRAPVEITDDVPPGVVSLPHGWGHDRPGTRLGVARAHAGVNSNRLTDPAIVDPLSGNAVLNGIPVEVVPAPADTPVSAASAPA